MYNDKDKDYFKSIRKNLLDLIPVNNKNGIVLEVGAASGDNLIYAKNNGYAKSIHGIELIEIKDSSQSSTEFNSFQIGDIEKMKIEFEKQFFDVIILGDVLEHLIDPWKTVQDLQGYLKLNGVFVVSMPNIRHYSIFKSIFLNGDFRYKDSGILDKTHLRFFTKKNIINLFTKVSPNRWTENR